MADYRAVVPALDKESTLWTFQDVVEHLLDVFEVTRKQSRNYRNVLRSIDTAYRDLPNVTRWKYYDRQATIVTEASYATGTITYDHTGGASERLLTFSGATLPDNFRHYRIIIAGNHYQIEKRLSSSTATLEQEDNPGSDVAAGTTYNSYRSSYPLPIDFRGIGRLFDVGNEQELTIVTDDTQHAQSIFFYDSPDTPWTAAIRSTGEFYGAIEVVFGPPPSTSTKYNFLYEGGPQPLRTELHAEGTITTDGTTTVEGAGTPLWVSKFIGAVLRVSSTSTVPTSKFGSVDGQNNPFNDQRIIHSVTDADTLVTDVLIAAQSAVGYTISDPIDIQPQAMFTAFLRMCESEFAVVTNLKDKDFRMAHANKAILHAMSNDRRTVGARTGIRYYDKFRRAIISTDS